MIQGVSCKTLKFVFTIIGSSNTDAENVLFKFNLLMRQLTYYWERDGCLKKCLVCHFLCLDILHLAKKKKKKKKKKTVPVVNTCNMYKDVRISNMHFYVFDESRIQNNGFIGSEDEYTFFSHIQI